MESLALALLLALACSVALAIGSVLVIDALLQIFGRAYGFGQNGPDLRSSSSGDANRLSEPRAYASGQNDSDIHAASRVRPSYSAF
jgi:hypothetical protein